MDDDAVQEIFFSTKKKAEKLVDNYFWLCVQDIESKYRVIFPPP